MAFIDACNRFVGTGEPFRILREFLNSTDSSRRAWALDKILSYGVGLPGQRTMLPSPADLFAEVARELAEARSRRASVALISAPGEPELTREPVEPTREPDRDAAGPPAPAPHEGDWVDEVASRAEDEDPEPPEVQEALRRWRLRHGEAE
jgi:hypothetical protein